MDPKEAMQEYQDLKIMTRKAEARMKELQPYIMPLVPEDKNVVTERGYFYIQSRPTWRFSPAVEAAETALDKLKEDEKQKGIAKASYKPALYWKEGEPEEKEAVM